VGAPRPAPECGLVGWGGGGFPFTCLLRVPLSPHGGDGSRVPRGARVCRRAGAD